MEIEESSSRELVVPEDLLPKFTVAELGNLLGVTKDRAKQLIDEELAKDPALDIAKGRSWDLGPETMRRIFQRRGVKFPIGKVSVIGVQKGGVGKTTLATNVAVELGLLGFRVLLCDTDPEAHATNFLAGTDFNRKKAKVLYDAFKEQLNLQDIVQKSRFRGVDFIPSALRNFNFESVADSKNPSKVLRPKMGQFRDYNVILLEVSPSLSVLSSACYLAADLIAMPCTPDAYSLESLPLTIQSIREIGDTFDRPIPQDRFRIIYNNTREHQTTQDGLKFLLENYEDMLFPVYIKHSIEVVKCNNAGYPIASSRPSEVRNQFRQIACLIGDLPLTGAQRGQD